MKIVDVNVLLYAGNQESPEHEMALRWWENALDGDESIGLAWLVILGFVRVSTNPRIFERPNSVGEACRKVGRWLDRRVVSLVREKDTHWRTLAGLLLEDGLRGNLVSDAHLAALALDHGATLVTCDSDFARFEGLRWENPLRPAH